jgi:hypothetical protein
LHCPWAPQGVWKGAWGPGAAEWASLEAQAALDADESLADELRDDATFWCSYWYVD